MEPILKPLKEDLLSLYNENYIAKARKLNQDIATDRKSNQDFIAENYEPMYFTGKFDAKTVFVMLNPGSKKEENYSFKSDTNGKIKYKDFDSFFQSHKKKHINYGFDDKDRPDNFDIKQAAFLYNFKDSGLELPNFMQDKDKKTMLMAKEIVLMNKLQLELVPYVSVDFRGIFDNKTLALKHIDFFVSHINRILEGV